MTQAVCFKCGEIKWGALNRCGQCQATPKTDDELMWSLAFSDQYFERDRLQQIGKEIKAGRTPQFTEAWREKLAPAVQEAKRLLGKPSARTVLHRSLLPMVTTGDPGIVIEARVVVLVLLDDGEDTGRRLASRDAGRYRRAQDPALGIVESNLL
jgi:hypothetical protein